MFFISQASTALAYNMMAKKTARSQKFIRNVDAFSGAVAIWALANVVVVAISIAKGASPPVRTLYRPVLKVTVLRETNGIEVHLLHSIRRMCYVHCCNAACRFHVDSMEYLCTHSGQNPLVDIAWALRSVSGLPKRHQIIDA